MCIEVDVEDSVLFTRSRANDAVTVTLEIPKTLWKIIEQHFQDVAQKVTNYNNSDSFSDYFAKHFTQKQSLQ